MKRLCWIKYFIEAIIDETFDKSGYFQPDGKKIRFTLFLARVVADARMNIKFGV